MIIELNTNSDGVDFWRDKRYQVIVDGERLSDGATARMALQIIKDAMKEASYQFQACGEIPE